ncbi:unnamed protein product [Colias eurytheme]|nr:unnamed protein product [Colias eurytheme]
MLQLAKNLVRRNLRNVMLTPRLHQSSSLVKLKKLQADFQCEDGQPIWLKRGFSDRVLYISTIVASYLGIIMTLGAVYENAKPESWKQKE